MKQCLLAVISVTLSAISAKSAVLTSIPGPDDQGGMIMPMVMLSGNSLSVMFTPPLESPLLASLEHWSPGDAFQASSAWYTELDPMGGSGALFNNQYGFTFMGSIPTGGVLGIRLLSASSNLLQSWNYVNSQNRFDRVFQNVGDQVLWNGSMWHSYFTIHADVDPGIYSATFQVFIANGAFTTGSGFVDYGASAQAATQDMNYAPVNITYSWEVAVVPEPSSILLLGGAGVFALFFKLSQRKVSKPLVSQQS